jgi:hypothetical protein
VGADRQPLPASRLEHARPGAPHRRAFTRRIRSPDCQESMCLSFHDHPYSRRRRGLRAICTRMGLRMWARVTTLVGVSPEPPPERPYAGGVPTTAHTRHRR